VLIILAAVGVLLLEETDTISRHGVPLVIDDFKILWAAANAMLHGRGAYPYYGGPDPNGYPPPFIVPLLPFGLLPEGWVAIAGRGVIGVTMAAALGWWSRGPDRPVGIAAIPLMLSAPVLSQLRLDHVMSALVLAALTTAIWGASTRRWWLVGLCAAVAMARPFNTMPLLGMLALLAFRDRRLPMLIAAGGGALVVMVAGAFLWDSNWVSDYTQGLSSYPSVGLPRLVGQAAGFRGIALLLLVATALPVVLSLRDRSATPDLDRIALVMAVTAVISPLEGVYVAVFCLPAILRLGLRPQFGWLPWAVGLASSAAVVLAAPLLLTGTRPTAMLTLEVPVIAALSYPLVRRPVNSQRL
jgi:hypothetical protein